MLDTFMGRSLAEISPILRLIGITQPSQQAGINGGLAIWNLATTLIAAQFVERVGRRPLWLTGHVGVLCTFTIVTGLSGSFATTRHAPTGIAVIPCLYIFYLFYNMAWATLANLCECFQHDCRTMANNVQISPRFSLSLFVPKA
jgi:MFS family permease